MTPPEAAPMREEDASKIAAYFIEAEDGQIVRDMAGHVGDEVHQVLKRHGMMMKSAAGAIGVGVLAGVQILNDTLEFALRSVDTDDERASIAAGIAALIQSEIDDSLAHTARPDAGDAGRYHFTDENPFEVRTVEGTKKLGRGWLAITEAEYAGLRARPDAGDEVERLIRELRNPWQDGPPNIERGPLPDWAGGLLDRAAAALAAMREGVDRGMVEEVPAVPEWLAKVLAENVARFDALPLAIKNARFSYVAAAALSRKGG